MIDQQTLTLTGVRGFFSRPNPKFSVECMADGSKNAGLDAEGVITTLPDIGSVALTQGSIPAGSYGRRAYLHGGLRAFGSSPGSSTRTRGGLAVFVGESGGSVRWEGAGPFAYLAGYIISITNGTATAPLGLPVPPALTLDTDPPAAGKYAVIAGGQIKQSVALKIALYRQETNSESWVSQSTGPIVPGGSGIQIKVHAPTVPGAYAVGTFFIRIYSTQQQFGASPLAQYYRIAEIAPGATVTLDYTDADLGALAPYTADSPSGTWTDPTTNPGKFGMPPAATWLGMAGANLLTVGCYDPPTGHLFHPSVAFSVDTFDPTTVGVANPPEPFKDFLENANDGYILGCQLNALGAFIQTGASDYPVIYRSLFRSLGVASKGQIATVSGEIWAWARNRGLIRSGMQDQPTSEFTAPVRAFLSGFSGTPLIGYDMATDRVAVVGLHSNPFGAGAAWVKLAYERGLPGDIWTSPDEITGFTPVSLETYDNDLYLVNAAGQWRAAYGGSTARETIAQFAPADPGHGHRVTVTDFSVSCSATPNVSITSGRSNAVVRAHAAVPLGAGGSSGLRATLANNVDYCSAKVTLPTGGQIDGAVLNVSIEDGAF